MRSLNDFFLGRKLFNGYTHDGSMGMVDLPIYLVDFYGKFTKFICHKWILWDRCGGYTSSEIYPL